MAAQKSKVTIFDVAKASGVSSSAVSYALNGKPGVSEATRAKVLEVARELGWKPNGAAQSLAQSKTRRIGLVLGYDPQLLAVEPYMMSLISGLGAELERKDYSLLVRMSMDHDDEDAIIEDWIATSNVDAMLFLNLEIGDDRIETMKQNPQMPVLAVADASLTAGLPTLASDDAAAVGLAVRHLYDLGHRSIARVAGPEETPRPWGSPCGTCTTWGTAASRVWPAPKNSGIRTSATPRSRRPRPNSASATAACTPTTRRPPVPGPHAACSA